MEVWKEIKGYEGKYQISSFGRVKSVKRFANIKCGSKRPIRERILKQDSDLLGYKRVSLSLNCKQKWHSVHRLVAIHFIINPGNKPEVNHKDKNTSNNLIENLEWVTKRENMVHRKYGSNKHYGISYIKSMQSYQVSIFFKGKKHYLGSSKNINIALEKRNKFLISNNIKNKYVCL